MFNVVFVEIRHPVSDNCYEGGLVQGSFAGKKLDHTSRKSSKSLEGFHGIEFLNDLRISDRIP